MKKIVKSYGNSLVITFDAEDQKVYGIRAGDVVDISDITVQRSKRK